MGAVTCAMAFLGSTLPEAALVATLLVTLLGGVALVTLYSFLIWKRVIR